jgi:hypothetical protein
MKCLNQLNNLAHAFLSLAGFWLTRDTVPGEDFINALLNLGSGASNDDEASME